MIGKSFSIPTEITWKSSSWILTPIDSWGSPLFIPPLSFNYSARHLPNAYYVSSNALDIEDTKANEMRFRRQKSTIKVINGSFSAFISFHLSRLFHPLPISFLPKPSLLIPARRPHSPVLSMSICSCVLCPRLVYQVSEGWGTRVLGLEPLFLAMCLRSSHPFPQLWMPPDCSPWFRVYSSHLSPEFQTTY